MTSSKSETPTSLLQSRNPIDVTKWLVSLVIKREWSGLAFSASVILWILLKPEDGLIIKDILPKPTPILYGRLFWLSEITLWSTGFLLLLFKELRSLKKKKKDKESQENIRKANLIKVFIATTFIIFILGYIRQDLRMSVRPSNFLQCDVSGDCFSWGENILMSYGYIQDNQSLDSDNYQEGNEDIDLNKSVSLWDKCKQSWRLKASATAVYDTDKAIDTLKAFRGQCPNDAEAVIYWNNLQALQSGRTFDIAVSLPISVKGGESESQELLRGVAIAQSEINQSSIANRKLLVGIADDGFNSNNKEDQALIVKTEREAAETIASGLINYPQIVGVIGHFSSDATEAANAIYNNSLVTISPTSTAIRNSQDYSTTGITQGKGINLNNFTFRTALSDGEVVSALISQLEDKGYRKIAVIYESNSKYSQLFKETFEEAFTYAGGLLIDDQDKCDFNRSIDYKEISCLQAAKESGAQALFLVPSTKSSKSVRDLIIKNSEDFEFPLIGADSMYDKSFLDEKTLDMLIYITWHRSDLDVGKTDFESSALEIFKTPDVNWRTATAYDATKVLAHGIDITSNAYCSKEKWISRLFFNDKTYLKCIRTNLQSTVSSKEFKANGVSGNDSIRFDKHGDRKNVNDLGVFVKVAKIGDSYTFIRDQS